MQTGNPIPVATIAAAVPDSGQYDWLVPNTIPPANDYRIRVTRNDFPTVTDDSDLPLRITAPISVYYVNDGAVEAGDITTEIGTINRGKYTFPKRAALLTKVEDVRVNVLAK